ncbi:MAG: rRNA maturation RNase YbeY [Acidimicrobiales bacterium]
MDRWRVLANEVLEAEGIRGAGELSLLFVSEPAIAALNEQFMGKSGPTDVLSFPIDAEDEEVGRFPDGGSPGPFNGGPRVARLPYLLGDVVIAPTVAARNATEHAGDRGHRGTFDDEIALLLVHGILHLRGMDHEIDDEAERMEAREDELLSRFYYGARGAEGAAG